MMIRRNRKGFTLVEIMIVVAIIGLLAAIAIPNFANARRTAGASACKANLRQLTGAVTAFAADAADGKYPGTLAGLTPDYIRTIPKCPGGYDYDTAFIADGAGYNKDNGWIGCNRVTADDNPKHLI